MATVSPNQPNNLVFLLFCSFTLFWSFTFFLTLVSFHSNLSSPQSLSRWIFFLPSSLSLPLSQCLYLPFFVLLLTGWSHWLVMQWQDQLQGNVWHAEAHVSSTRPWEEVSSTGGLQGQKGPHLHPSLLWVLGGFWGVQEGGPRDLSAQSGVNFSVVVSLVLFLFLFRGKWGWAGWCCGVVWWCGISGWR